MEAGKIIDLTSVSNYYAESPKLPLITASYLFLSCPFVNNYMDSENVLLCIFQKLFGEDASYCLPTQKMQDRLYNNSQLDVQFLNIERSDSKDIDEVTISLEPKTLIFSQDLVSSIQDLVIRFFHFAIGHFGELGEVYEKNLQESFEGKVSLEAFEQRSISHDYSVYLHTKKAVEECPIWDIQSYPRFFESLPKNVYELYFNKKSQGLMDSVQRYWLLKFKDKYCSQPQNQDNYYSCIYSPSDSIKSSQNVTERTQEWKLLFEQKKINYDPRFAQGLQTFLNEQHEKEQQITKVDISESYET